MCDFAMCRRLFKTHLINKVEEQDAAIARFHMQVEDEQSMRHRLESLEPFSGVCVFLCFRNVS